MVSEREEMIKLLFPMCGGLTVDEDGFVTTFLSSSSGGTMEAGGTTLSTPMLFVPKVLFLKRWHRGKPDRG